MKKLLFSFVFIFFLFPKPVFAEEINSYSVRADIQKEGKVLIKEVIEYNFGQAERHGIYRTIPLIKTNKQGKRFKMDLRVISITDEVGQRYSYSKTGKDEMMLKIGSANKTVTGTHTYIITYEISGGLTYFSDHDEFYWNVNGNQWQVPINNLSFEIKFPFDMEKNDIKIACYLGQQGSIDQNCLNEPSREKILLLSPRRLNIGEGLTAVVGFPKNLVAVLEPKEILGFGASLLDKLIILLIMILIFLWYVVYPIKIIFKWFKYGKDPKPIVGTTSAWYDPPKNKQGRFLTPAEVGTLIDESADLKDVSATIIDLARRGFIKIEERKKKDWYLIKTKEPEGFLGFEKKLVNGIFESGKTIRIKDEKLYSTIESVKDEIYSQMVNNGFFPEDPKKVRDFYGLVALGAFFTANFPLLLISLTFGRVMPVKTQLGVDALAVARSLKNFLITQERQYAFQAKEKFLFEKLLPYAIVFGVEKIWAERFKNLDIKNPAWYSGYNQANFNSALLVSGLHSTMNSMSSSFSPTTSSSGFSSGFSGGGFSGGGGGGGGGGSW